MNNLPKCTSNSYSREPFYLLQADDNCRRYTVQLNDQFRIRILLSGFIESLTAIVEIRIKSYEDPFNPIVYSGNQERSRIQALMTEFEEVIFHNGYHDLIIQDPDAGECIIFDQHGLIYMNTNRDYSDNLGNLGAEFKQKEKLISQSFHWHHSSESLDEKLVEFINVLGLIKVE
ncbi:hypothetical protein WBG78_19370 [Chryseolinea sp. T2]|uniref:hypothetical protein n=1 Tax=Chryseolinea sp. T2 TaxID=3129255 RepID=UPI0030768FFA